jgi:transposase InsO family protein
MKNQNKYYSVAIMSKTLGVSCSGYYKWLKQASKKRFEKSKIETYIEDVFKDSYQTYGSPRVAIALRDKGIYLSKSSVARIMKSLCLIARPKRKFVSTTDSDHNYKVAPNLLNRNFQVEHINKVWVSDITYVRVSNKWMYLTTVIDLADRMVVGWSLSSNMSTKDTVVDAFNNALLNRGICKKNKLLVHSDRGVQYASQEFRSLLAKYDCTQSMSRKGNCWDNAVAESFFKTIKEEALNRYVFSNQEMLKSVIFRYINGWYNTVRIHSTLGGLSPLKTSILKKMKYAA